MFRLTAPRRLLTLGMSALLVLMGLSVATAKPAQASTASAATAAWYCGSSCNNLDPYKSKLPYSDGTTFTCAQTKKLVSSGHPVDSRGVGDAYMTVWVYYSTFCQTLWLEAKNTKAVGRAQCETDVWITKTSYSKAYGCPAAGYTSNTMMVDDHCYTANTCVAAGAGLYEEIGATYPSYTQLY